MSYSERTTNKMRPFSINLFLEDALHVSGGFSVHHWELKTAHTASGICRTDTARVKTVCDGTRAETRFGLPAKRTSPIISAGVSVQSSTGFLGVRVGRERL